LVMVRTEAVDLVRPPVIHISNQLPC